MQRPEEECIKEPTTFILEYPTIAVHGTPDSWSLYSQIVTMASNHDDGSFEDTSSSLGDSSYDFIDDRSIVTSDDEESQSAMTHSISSNEHDIDRNDEHPPGPSAPTDNARGSDPYDIQPGSVFAGRGNSLQSESELTTQGVDLDEGSILKTHLSHGQPKAEHENKQPHILLTEPPPVESTKPMKGFWIIRVFTGHNVTRLLHSIPPDCSPEQVTVKVEQTMVSQGLLLEEPYKVLYVGDAMAKDAIIQKIGAALAATARADETRPSKFNVVPISSFGDTTSPDVVLVDSSGIELSVDECVSSTFVRKDEGNDTIRMTLADGMTVESSWSGSRFLTSNHWKLPDVAIFYLSTEDTILAKQTERFARSFMNRHNVPVIIISDVSLWSSRAGTHALDPRTPRLLLEAYSHSAGKYQTINQLPIDLPTFLLLDAGQMSRNLAYLALAQGSSTSRRKYELASNIENVKAKACSHGNYQLIATFNTFRKAFSPALVIVLSMLLFQLIMSNVFRPSRTSEPAINTEVSRRAAITPAVTSLESTPTAAISRCGNPLLSSSVASPIPEVIHVPKSISTVHENTDITSYLASFLAETHPLTPNNSDKFKMHVIGDRHIVLRPPYWFTRSKKTPKLLFNVTRDRIVLDHQVSPLFDGLYALKLRRADAHGVLNISVWTTSKPKIHETFQVALKIPWLRLAGWREAAKSVIDSIREDIDFAQNTLTNTSNLARVELRTLMQSTLGSANLLTKEATTLKAASRSLSKKLQGQRASVSRTVEKNVQQMRKTFALHVQSRRSMISNRAGRVSQDFEAIVHEIGRQREKHLRKTQKAVLKEWWRIRGLPRQKSVEQAKDELHRRTNRSKKPIGR